MKNINKCENLTGQKFGKLTAIKIEQTETRKTFWLCHCECGNLAIIRSDQLKKGNNKSCGCLKKEQDKINLTKNHSHKMTATRLYKEWIGIKSRCRNPKNRSYDRYGGRGISICNEWYDSFEIFRNWALSNGYADNLTIERIDNNGNYEPSNCKYATSKEQANNRRSNIQIEYDGKKYTLLQLAELFNLNYGMLIRRYNYGDRGERLLRANGTDRQKKRGEENNKTKITEEIAKEIKISLENGIKQSELARKYGVSKYLIYDIKRGKTWTWVK